MTKEEFEKGEDIAERRRWEAALRDPSCWRPLPTGLADRVIATISGELLVGLRPSIPANLLAHRIRRMPRWVLLAASLVLMAGFVFAATVVVDAVTAKDGDIEGIEGTQETEGMDGRDALAATETGGTRSASCDLASQGSSLRSSGNPTPTARANLVASTEIPSDENQPTIDNQPPTINHQLENQEQQGETKMNIKQKAAAIVAMTASLALSGASPDTLTFITGGSLGSTAILSTSSNAPDIVFEGASIAEYEPAYAYFNLHTPGGQKGSVSTDIEQEILRPYNVVRTTEDGVATMTVQFQGVTRTHILPHTASITIKFMQSGDNIAAYVMRAAALKPLDIELGLDLDAMVDAGNPRVEAKPLTGDGKYNVSVIAMRKPAEDIAYMVQEGDSISDTFTGNASVTISHAAADTATYDGYLPNNEWVTIATNHDLADLDEVEGIFHYKVGSITNVQQTAYNLKYLTIENNVNSFGEKVCQFQRVNGRYICALLVYFSQNGTDVQVHTRQGLSCYLDSDGHEDEIVLGVDFERYGAATTPKRISYNSLASSDSDTYQGVKNLRCKFRSKATTVRDGYMPNGNNDTANYWTVVAENHTLSDLVGVDAFYHTGVNAGHYVTCENLNLSTSPATCQFQYDNGTYVFCIGLDIRQTGNSIEARTGKMRNWHMQKTLYEDGVVYYGIDFHNYSTTTTPKRNTYGGYGESDSVSTKGLKNLRFRFATGGVVYAAASTAQNGHDLKFSGSADAPLAARTSTSTTFPSNGVVTVAPYAELKLAGHVANAQWTQYRVLTTLWAARCLCEMKRIRLWILARTSTILH